MGTKVHLQMDPTERILLKRNLNKNGKGQQFFTHEVRRLSDPYVPFLNGPLSENVMELPNQIIYNSPYARRQWYENQGKNRRFHQLAGGHWTERMWPDRGKEITRAVAAYCGGRAK